LTSAHQNDLKTLKNNKLKQKNQIVTKNRFNLDSKPGQKIKTPEFLYHSYIRTLVTYFLIKS